MITSLAFFKRRPDLDLDAFRRHWQSTHRDLVLRLPGLRRYVQNPVHDSGYRRHEPRYDGVAQVTFDDLDALRAITGSAEASAVLDDERNFLDLSTRGELLVTEEVVLDGEPPASGLTMLIFVNRRPGTEPDAFRSYWRHTHGPLGAAIPGVRRYVQHHVLPNIYAAGRQPAYDGVAQTWFDDLDAMRAAAGTPERAATLADEPNFAAPGELPFVVCTPLVMR